MFFLKQPTIAGGDDSVSLSISLLNMVSRRSYTLKCELRRDQQKAVNALPFRERLESLRRSIENATRQ
ncbi:hypothetical protein MRS76_21405 [Rhizobiaceae bacterium n13]|uniref:Uncharacterized protein n=1 Tax=Ferirhizobium litorale TaxID=2927786 RepID=A0AAE3QKI1_9HYPH|nr:hypothetical protein [Fererhizobium litorale]MDI7864496.1 hypothetical protein [Fererhizobium litorale]MDI7924753.1 hypothetical protein [Fererhizobium litorale]